jgi:ribosome-associated heat shock protein Hsp15
MAETQRLDKWLWFARVVKTRARAVELVSSGHVRLNARRIDAPAKTVAQGDILTIALEREVRVLKVLDPGRRRAAYPEARLLFEELSDRPAALE